MTSLLNSNMKFYRKLVDNEKLRNKLKSALFDLLYLEYNKKKNLKKINRRHNFILHVSNENIKLNYI